MLYLHNIASGVWAIDPSAADNFLPLVTRYLRGDLDTTVAPEINPLSYSDDDWEEGSDGERPTEADHVAILTLCGPITKYDQACGPRGMKSCAEILGRLDKDPAVKGLVVRLDTPGGEVSGGSILTEAVRRFSKPTVAFVDDLCASAGYWIASQCDVVVAYSERANIGSIGAFTTLVDYSKKLEKEGISIIELYATKSTKKNGIVREAFAGNTKPLQDHIDGINEMFLSSVATGRGERLTANESDWGTGAMFTGRQALEMGLIDAIDSFDNILNYF